MANKEKKRSILARIRNYFIAGIVVLIPIAITIYITLFLITISSEIIPKEINPNHYLNVEQIVLTKINTINSYLHP